jgi:hypothetical protein
VASRYEKILVLQQKTQTMLASFEGLNPPKGPFFLKPHIKVVDLEKYIDTNLTRMVAQWADPFNTTFVNAFLALQDLKNYLCSNSNG